MVNLLKSDLLRKQNYSKHFWSLKFVLYHPLVPQ